MATNGSESSASSCKVVLLGESGVGKSCMINRFIHDTFSDGYISTKGASYAAKSMTFDEYEGKSLKFEIWDTAGQERFRALNKIFYKDAAIAVLVYDITREASFEEIQKYWYKALCENAPKNIAANKNDLYENEKVDENIVRSYAKKIGALFKQTSASNAFGIDDLFKAVGKKYLDPNYNEDACDEQKTPLKNNKKSTNGNDNGNGNSKKDNFKIEGSEGKKDKKKKKWC